MNHTKSQGSLADYPINTKIKLALLWASLMFLYIYADYFRLMSPDKLKEMINLQTPVGPATPGLLIIFSLILIIPALMIILSIFLKPAINKWLNIVFGFLYAVISILIVVAAFGDQWQMFFVLYNVVELFVLLTIIGQAWKWPRNKLTGNNLQE